MFTCGLRKNALIGITFPKKMTNGNEMILFSELFFQSLKYHEIFTICFFLAKGLTLYQVMAPNAYSVVKSYVPSLNKSVQSKIHHQVINEYLIFTDVFLKIVIVICRNMLLLQNRMDKLTNLV